MKTICLRALSLLLACTTVILFSSCGNSDPRPEEEIIEFTLTSEPLSLDPQIATDYSSVLLIGNLFEGLVREGADASVKNGIAESWDVSEDGLVYTFHLIKDTCWSNGTPVTASDFVFGITRALDPATRSESAHDLYLIKNAKAFADSGENGGELGVRALDDTTLEITLEYPSDNLLHVLTLPVSMPCNEEFFSSSKGKYGKEPELLITNGPFRIKQDYGWDHNKYIHLRRSENYTAPNKAVPLGINFTIGDAPGDPIAAVSSGKADICEIYGDQLLRANENGLEVETVCNTLWGICYNTDIMAFKNAKFRVALFGSLDRDALLKDVPESCVRTSQLIKDGISFGGCDYRRTVGDFTLDKAADPAQMFEKAVEELNEKEIKIKSSYTVLCLDDDTSSRIVTDMISKWNTVTGSYFNKEALSRGELEQRIRTGNYEIAVAPLNTAVDSPMEFLSSFRTDSPGNFIRLNYPAYNGFIDTAMSTHDVAEIISSLSEAEKYLIEYGYLYPLYYESRYFAYAPQVSGAVFTTAKDGIDFTSVTKIREEKH